MIPGVAADLSHIPTGAKVRGYGANELGKALEKSEVVVIPAGVPRKPGMTRDDLFNINAGIVKGIVEEVAKSAPNACVLIISNPVNSTVPIAAEVLKKAGKYNPKKLFGVTTLDVIRAQTFVAEHIGSRTASLRIPVVGGHAGTTILPLFSQVSSLKLSQKDRENLTQRVMFGGDEVVKAKGGAGSATLSMAYAGYLFTKQVLRALGGDSGLIECSFVESKLIADTPFLASPVRLGKQGIEEVLPIGNMDAFEQQKFEEMLKDLRGQIQKGVDFVRNPPKSAK